MIEFKNPDDLQKKMMEEFTVHIGNASHLVSSLTDRAAVMQVYNKLQEAVMWANVAILAESNKPQNQPSIIAGVN